MYLLGDEKITIKTIPDKGLSAELALGKYKLILEDFSAYYSGKPAIKDISMKIKTNSVTAIIGPSGCGKTTLIRCFNRLHELIHGATTSGKLMLDGLNIYENGVNPILVRRKIGMVFQKPNPFPTMSVYDNVAAGMKLNGVRNRHTLDAIVKRCLEMAALWDEVKDELDRPGVSLSGGQQQRLCIARALATEPEVLCMDEPASALDPISTAKIEQLIDRLKQDYTIVIVTHNMQQAARVSDYTAFIYLGKLVEFGPTKQIFENPTEKLTEDYISGRFG
ncbi:MAG: phosphate ABC transporter ATP-binding protein PstB [Nitrososphaerales archaeon]